MFPVTFYLFDKKRNSTARPPSSAERETYHCSLIDECGIVAPVIRLLGAKNDFKPVGNYCRIAIFDRYYFVNEWKYMGGCWVVYLNIDALASWWRIIGTSTQYVTRASAAYNNRLRDPKYGVLEDPNAGYLDFIEVENSLYAPFYQNGTFILSCVGKQGLAAHYAFSYADFYTFADKLFSDSTLGNLITKQAYNPLQYVIRAFWIPVKYDPTLMPMTTAIDLGWDYKVEGINAWILSGDNGVPSRELKFTSVYFDHPNADRGMYVYNKPYTNLAIYWPPIGNIEVDLSSVVDATLKRIYFNVRVDYFTGSAVYEVKAATTGEVAAKFVSGGVADLSIPIPLTQSAISGLGVIGGLVGAFVGAWSGQYGAAVSSLGGAMKSAAFPTFQRNGGEASNVHFRNPPRLLYSYYTLEDDSPDVYGRPLCENRQIDTIPGFIQVDNPVLEIAATAQETAIIIQHMKEGFYYV